MKAIVKEYDAFISYRHCELDSFVAEQLHKRLEAFRLPKYLAEQRKTGEKTRISRVFRDKEELPLATNLSDPIQEALEKLPKDVVFAAGYFHDTIIPLMNEVRSFADTLEMITDKQYWPYPTYSDLLYY